jgi:hypothetical protein
MQEYHRLMAIAKDTTGPEGAAPQDSTQALRQAMQIQQRAWQKYQDTLKDLRDLTTRGKPEDSET